MSEQFAIFGYLWYTIHVTSGTLKPIGFTEAYQSPGSD